MNNEIETYIYDNYVSKLIKYSKDTKYILKQDIDSLNLSENEKIFFYSILKNRNINIETQLLEEPEKELFNKREFGIYRSNDLESIQSVKKSEINYTKEGVLVGEDYSKLVHFLEEKFIPNNVVMTKVKKNRPITHFNEEKEVDFWEYSRADKDLKYRELCPTIQLSKIENLNLSEKEIEYVFSYLKQRGIIVRGKNSTFDQDFENYDYYSTYRSQILPKPLEKDELLSKFVLYKKTKDPILKEQLILSNLRLVPYVAWKYSIMYNIPVEEIESYGYEGLIESIDKYNPELGFSFSTYAIEHIKGVIKTGIYSISNINRNWEYLFCKCKQKLEETTGRTIENDESFANQISELMYKESEERVNKNPNASPPLYVSKDPKIKEQVIKSNAMRILFTMQENIDEYIYKEEEYEDGVSFYNDNNDYDLESMFELDTYVYTKDLNEKIREILNTLKPIEKQVLIIRFGLNGEEPKELDATAKIMGFTRERIRIIESKALRKMRHPSRTKLVRDFYMNEMIDLEKIDEISTTKRH